MVDVKPKPTRIEHAVMNVTTVVILIVGLASTLVGGTWALAQSCNKIDTNTTAIKQLKEVQDAAVGVALDSINDNTVLINDVKRGQNGISDEIRATNARFDLLIQELRIRNVVSETAAESPP